jgi:hypothetical protein
MQWVPVSTASKLLKVSRQRIHVLIARGSLASQKVDGTVLVSYESIDRRRRAQLVLSESR